MDEIFKSLSTNDLEQLDKDMDVLPSNNNIKNKKGAKDADEEDDLEEEEKDKKVKLVIPGYQKLTVDREVQSFLSKVSDILILKKFSVNLDEIGMKIYYIT